MKEASGIDGPHESQAGDADATGAGQTAEQSLNARTPRSNTVRHTPGKYFC